MNITEILVITSMVGTGFILLGFIMGFLEAAIIIGTCLGALLVYSGLMIVLDMIKMKADESLHNAQAKRQGEMMVKSAYAAKDERDKVEGRYTETIDGQCY